MTTQPDNVELRVHYTEVGHQNLMAQFEQGESRWKLSRIQSNNHSPLREDSQPFRIEVFQCYKCLHWTLCMPSPCRRTVSKKCISTDQLRDLVSATLEIVSQTSENPAPKRLYHLLAALSALAPGTRYTYTAANVWLPIRPSAIAGRS